MTYFAITAQYPVFTELDGTPLENGYVYIGEANDNPITNPITVYWDDGLLYPAAQPIRTLAGTPNRNGSPSPIYCAENFSIEIKDKNGNHIFYSPDGVKNYTSASLSNPRNYIINGKFDISQHRTADSQADLWTENYNDYTMVNTRNVFITTDDKPKEDSKYYMSFGVNGLASAVDDSYARFCGVIEDVTSLSGEIVTLSWYDRYNASNPANRYAVSMSQIMPTGSASSDVTGIGTQIFYPAADFTRRSITVEMPNITGLDLDYSDQEDINTSYILINFWLAAGSDYNSETGSLGNYLGSGALYIDITDVRLNQGSIINDSNDMNYAERLNACKRYYERSNSIYDNDATVTGDGYITFVAGSANTTIPGFRFTKEKRSQSPTVHVYSANDGTIDTVYRVGTGNVAVSNYHDVNSTGVGYIELGAATVANNVYQYHWTANDDFTI